MNKNEQIQDLEDQLEIYRNAYIRLLGKYIKAENTLNILKQKKKEEKANVPTNQIRHFQVFLVEKES